MDLIELRESLSRLAAAKQKVRITRSVPSEPLHNGFVLGVGEQLVMLWQFHDFYPEGFTTLRLSDITEIQSGEHEQLWQRMLAGEGLLDQRPIAPSVDLDDTRSLLISLRHLGENVIVEC